MTPSGSRKKPYLTGSSGNDEPVFLAVGKLRRPHGVLGEMVMEVLTDFPERLAPGVQLYIGSERRLMRLQSLRHHKVGFLVTFEGIDNPEEAGKLRNHLVFVRADDRPPLPEGEYYHHQILGLRVITREGKILGTITEIIETGANDVYVVQPESGAEILLPAIRDVVTEIDLDSGEMRVRLLSGLLPEG